MNARGFCECGCGQRTKLAEKTRSKLGWVKGEPIRFILGHNEKPPPRPKMPEQPCEFCGELFQPRRSGRRYCSLRCSGKANRNCVRYAPPNTKSFNRWEQRWSIRLADGRKMRLARWVMEQQIGRPLRRDELVHHINEDTTDDRPENLRIVTRKEHYECHRTQIVTARWGTA